MTPGTSSLYCPPSRKWAHPYDAGSTAWILTRLELAPSMGAVCVNKRRVVKQKFDWGSLNWSRVYDPSKFAEPFLPVVYRLRVVPRPAAVCKLGFLL